MAAKEDTRPPPYAGGDADDTNSEIVDVSEDACFRIFPRSLCHPKYALHRYFVLIFMCALGFGKLLGILLEPFETALKSILGIV